MHQLYDDNPVSRGRPRLVESEREKNLVKFWFKRQAGKQPASVEHVLSFMRESGIQVNRFWINKFMERNTEILTLRQAIFLEQDRDNVTADDLKHYFNHLQAQMRSLPLPTIVGTPKKKRDPHVIGSGGTGPNSRRSQQSDIIPN